MEESNIKNNLTETVLNNFIDREQHLPDGNLSANLIFNQNARNNVYRVLKMKLATCKAFTFAVAFITHDGLSNFLTILADLKKAGIKGRILTSTYLYFNKPEVFRALMKIDNVEVRIFDDRDEDGELLPFHAKGYLFDYGQYRSVVIGSSNLTSNALLKNNEWNLNVNSLENAELTEQISLSIENEWAKSIPLTQEWLNVYQIKYEHNQFKQEQPLVEENSQIEQHIEPNKMQEAALKELASFRKNGKTKALIISATGTGKTYLGAFDVRRYQPKRFLFVVHREQILEKSLHSFYRVIGGNLSDYGIYSGNRQDDLTAKYVFATVQTLSKEENLQKFKPDEFDYVLYDEAHHLAANQHQKVFNYFRSKFCLGMTATPERTDDYNIFKLFDYQVAYEIRLEDALKAKILCPFHYYGVEDYFYQDQLIGDKASLKRLASNERVDYIIQQTEYYGYSGDVLHGLIFCSSVEEAKALAILLTEKGYPSQALSGADSPETRNQAVQALEAGKLKYLLTVDIFNEGIDILTINQVVFLRTTQSSIVFIQQLGRGLRKASSKTYLTVIDFIGNYANNYLIPIALSGDKSHNKENIRDNVDMDPIVDVSIINFTEVAKEQIYRSINNKNMSNLLELRKEFQLEKMRLGHIPTMYELQRDSIDCQVIADKCKQYVKFLSEMKEEVPEFSEYQLKVLQFLTVVLANGKRKHELLLLNSLLDKQSISYQEFKQLALDNDCYFNLEVMYSVDQLLTLAFYDRKSLPNKDSFGGHSLIKHQNGSYQLNDVLRAALQNPEYMSFFRDAVQTGILRSEQYQSDQLFTIGKRYSRTDACRILCWEKILPGLNIGGYRFDDEHHNCCIFVTYDKNDCASLRYTDRFIGQSILNMYSKTKRNLESKDIKAFANPDYELHLFIQKSDDDQASFIYLGTCKAMPESFKPQTMKVIKGKDVKMESVVSLNLKLDTPVDLDTYYMLTKVKY